MTASDRSTRPKVSVAEWAVMAVASAIMVGLTWFHIWSLDMTQVMGTVTGGVSLWLVVREHWLNWPIGLACNLYFVVLFFNARLYSDMGLNLLTAVLVLYGWWNWFHGTGVRHELIISKTTPKEWVGLALFVPLYTAAMTPYLTTLKDAAPLWDSLTTALGLASTFLTCRKRLESWLVYVVAQAIMIPLYYSRGLPLTAILIAVFLVMNIYGFFVWNKKWKAMQLAANSTSPPLAENSPSSIANHGIPAIE